jgi:D-alanyl-D-alanine carboxypeptidase (penicillin-binding protein 5/6)
MRRVAPRASGLALAAALVAAPALANEDPEDAPRVGGDALYRSGLIIDGASAPLPQSEVASFLIADLDSGEVLAAQNAHEQLPPASTMKMLTALTVLPRVALDEIYTATTQDVAVEGSRVGIVEGSTYTARQLLEGMFLISGNDAANAVASLGGGISGTVAQMQAEAGRLQAYDTEVRNPSGLDAEGQLSSAYDLALIARAGLQEPVFAELAALDSSTFPMSGATNPEDRPTFEIWNQNTLVAGAYEGAIGVKSGFTTQAGRTFAAAAERDGEQYLVVLMGIVGNTYRTGADYLDWAFAHAADLEPVGTLVPPKFDRPSSDAAALIPAGKNAATGLEIAASGSGRAPLLVAGITATAALTLWWLVRSPYRRALRRRHPVSEAVTQPRVIDLRDDVRV